MQSRVGQSPPIPAGNAGTSRTRYLQNKDFPLGSRALVTQLQLALNQDSQVTSCSFSPASLSQSAYTARTALSQVWDLALAFAKFHMVGDCPSLTCQGLLQGL